MQESKYQVANWKKWKATRNLLASTKTELMNDVKAISYTNELPGGSHKSVAEKAMKLRAQYREKYGPISPNECLSLDKWCWIEGPWPWEN